MERWFNKEIYDAFSKSTSNLYKKGSIKSLIKNLQEKQDKNIAEIFLINQKENRTYNDIKRAIELIEEVKRDSLYENVEYDIKSALNEIYDIFNIELIKFPEYVEEQRLLKKQYERECERQRIKDERQRIKIKKQKRKEAIRTFMRIIACLLAIVAFFILYSTYEYEHETREINGQHIVIRDSLKDGSINIMLFSMNIINIAPFLAIFFTPKEYRGLRKLFLCIGILLFLIMLGSCYQFEDEFSGGGISAFLCVSLVSKIIAFLFPKE
ncbi:MAG: hypothetical protein FWD48_01490 [Oscillospiraceae bacterium]|nr:hypothetical protein [Oscillospiraceae bacterium]